MSGVSGGGRRGAIPRPPSPAHPRPGSPVLLTVRRRVPPGTVPVPRPGTLLAWTLLLLTVSLAVFPGVVSGLTCEPCDRLQCPSPLTCVGGLTLDPCACCLTCARQVNETCGGLYGIQGNCDVGLTCSVSPEHGASPEDASLAGVCTAPREISLEQLCDTSTCETEQTLTCPNDSTTVVKPADMCCPPATRCHCRLCDSDDLQCGPDELKVIQETGTGMPGNCCDLYQCRSKAEVCSNVTCEEREEVKCPEDSEPLPESLSHDGCCSFTPGCKCKPKEECPTLTCPEGQRVQIKEPAIGQPGSCCDKTQCDLGLSCKYGETEYQDGETWSPKPCTTCSCRSKLVFCSTVECENTPPPMCGWLGLEEDSQCCHVCKGCMSVDGQRYANGETWDQDACTTCRCENGVPYCQAAFCGIECSHPRKVAGRCCPVCDDEIFVTLPPHCPKDDNCSLLCWNGRKQDDRGCYTCECNPEPEEECNLHCPSGFRLDDQGRETCACADSVTMVTPPSLCPPLTRCKKKCAYGFKTNKAGCERCRCKKCPEFSCKKKCAHGYIYNNKGCKVCKCRAEASGPQGTLTTDLGPMLPTPRTHCMSVHGRRMEDGETWYDGCRRCFCHDRSEWCSLITCPLLLCKNPVVRPADCCPTCPEDNPNVIVPGEPTQCQASGGTFRTEGETWSLDSCTKCICHAGGVLCQIESCPPLFCNVPVRLPGQCCPFCPEGNDFFPMPPVQSARSCTTSTGAKFADQDSWKVNACQSCVCRAGQVHCFSQTCPLLTCNHTLLKKGQCCPFCVEDHASSTCRHEGETYGTGESWLIETCRQCMCDHGHVICSKMICPPPRCRRPVSIPGICCPICTNATYEPTEPSVEQVPPVSAPNRTRTKTPTDVDDVPREDHRFQVFGITVGILGALVVLLIPCVVILLIVLYRTRRKTEAPLSAAHSAKVTEVLMAAPKSTNLELQGFTPMPNGGVLLKKGVLHGNGQVKHGTQHGYDGPVVLRNENYASEKPSNLKPKVNEKTYRNSCADGMLSYNLTVPTDPNDFRKSV